MKAEPTSPSLVPAAPPEFRRTFTGVFGKGMAAIQSEAALTVVCRILGMAAGLGTTLLTARILEPAGRGVYVYVIAVANIITQFGNLGLQVSNTFFVAKDERLVSRLTVNSLWISIVLGLLGSAATLCVMLLKTGPGAIDVEALKFIFALAPLSIFFLLGCNLLIGQNRLKAFNFFQCITSVLTLLFTWLISRTGAHVSLWLIAPIAASSISCGGILFVLIRNEWAALSLRFDSTLFKESLRYSVKAYLTALLSGLVPRCAIFIVEALRGSAQLGVFSIAQQMSDILTLVPVSIGLVLFPKLIRAGESERWKMMKASLGIVALFMGLECLGVAIFGHRFIVFAFGPKYVAGGEILVYMLPGVVGLGLCSVISQHLGAQGFPAGQIFSWFFVLIAGTLLCLWLTASAGLKGTALSLSAAYVLAFVFLWMVARGHESKSKAVRAGRKNEVTK